jgi:23S rRNA (uridine2552-2'-O)-methyltransferase
MGSQWSNDRVYQRAMREGYRSRAAYKLVEIQERFGIIRQDDNVLDLGAAPGSWLQVTKSLTGGLVVGVDLNPIGSIEGVTTITGDFTERETVQEILSLMPLVTVVLCDASPQLSGQRSYDQARAIALGESALKVAVQVLKPGGNFAIKSFQGEDFASLLAEIRKYFYSVKTFKTKSSRKGSTEIYIVAKKFKGEAAEE